MSVIEERLADLHEQLTSLKKAKQRYLVQVRKEPKPYDKLVVQILDEQIQKIQERLNLARQGYKGALLAF